MALAMGTSFKVPSPGPCGVIAVQPWKVRNALHTAGDGISLVCVVLPRGTGCRPADRRRTPRGKPCENSCPWSKTLRMTTQPRCRIRARSASPSVQVSRLAKSNYGTALSDPASARTVSTCSSNCASKLANRPLRSRIRARKLRLLSTMALGTSRIQVCIGQSAQSKAQ